MGSDIDFVNVRKTFSSVTTKSYGFFSTVFENVIIIVFENVTGAV